MMKKHLRKYVSMFLCDINQIQFHFRREITHLKRQDISKCCSRIRNDFVCHKRLDFKICPNQELYYKTLKKQKTAALLLSGAFTFDFKFFLLSRSQILNCYHLLKSGLNTKENCLNCCFFVFYRFVFSFYFFSIFVFLIITKCKKKKANKKTTTKKTKKETILEYIN